MKLFDTHAHYDDAAFDGDRDELLLSLNRSGVTLINPGCDLRSSIAAIELAEKYDFVYAAVGIHPEELAGMKDKDLREIRELAGHPKCVAIGEIGLDYYWDQSRKDEQLDLFRKQMQLAGDLGLPVIIHDREAHADSMSVIKDYPGITGTFHCYSGSREMAAELLKAGWYLGFDGPVTYKNARKALEVLSVCPADRMLIETDSPYLSPVPNRGKRNDSSNLRYVVERIAETKSLSPEEVASVTYRNAVNLFLRVQEDVK